MTTRYDGLVAMRARVRPGRADVARVQGLARDFREPVVIPSPPAKGEPALVFGLLALCLVICALTVVGAIWVGCWLWPDRLIIGRLLFWLTVAGLTVVAGRVIVTEIRRTR